MKSIQFKPSGVCASKFSILANENDIITSVKIEGGCAGNSQGVARLVEGMSIDTAIKKLEGIKCGYRPTSCPDRLACALKELKEKPNT